jgi:hypothetical protein
MLFISGTLYQICLFEFIRVEGGVKFKQHFKGGTNNKSLGTSELYRAILFCRKRRVGGMCALRLHKACTGCSDAAISVECHALRYTGILQLRCTLEEPLSIGMLVVRVMCSHDVYIAASPFVLLTLTILISSCNLATIVGGEAFRCFPQ